MILLNTISGNILGDCLFDEVNLIWLTFVISLFSKKIKKIKNKFCFSVCSYGV